MNSIARSLLGWALSDPRVSAKVFLGCGCVSGVCLLRCIEETEIDRLIVYSNPRLISPLCVTPNALVKFFAIIF